MKTRKFSAWWAGLNTKPTAERRDIIKRWMYYATKTVSCRGNQDQQLVVHTIVNRYSKSKWDIPMVQAKVVYDIINKKQQAYHKELAKRKSKSAPTIEYRRRKVTKKIISGGSGSVNGNV